MEHLARMWDTKNVYKILIGKPHERYAGARITQGMLEKQNEEVGNGQDFLRTGSNGGLR